MKNIKNIINNRFLFSTIIILLLSFEYSYSQLTTDNSVNITQLVNYMFGNDVTVSNIAMTGDPMAIGSFDGTSSNIGMKYGIILSTGYITNAAGPNDDPLNGSPLWTDILKSKDFGRSGDADLEALQGCSNCSFDAEVLEFDIVPKSSLISLKYVFASEEYPYYVCSQFNDVFALFVSGPKPSGGNYTKQNIALIPGTSIPVAINSVNVGSPGYFKDPNCNCPDCICSWPSTVCTSLKYSSYYIDNGDGSTPNINKTVQYNGFTVPLTASINVISGMTYHIKIAITDVADGKYDSAILLEANTLSVDAGENKSVLCGESVQLSAVTNYKGSGQLNYQWSPSTGLSATDIPNPIAKPANTTTYMVTLTIPDNGMFVDSVTISFQPLQTEEICFVEFDTLTSKNSINWKTNLSSKIDSVHIYNEVSTDVWKLIGTVSAAQHNFIDQHSNPFSQSYSYKISVKDTCGYETSLSDFHTTITLLATYDSGTKTYGFTWSPYQGLPIANYYLFGVNAIGTETLIGTVPGNQYFYNYIDPSPDFVKYFVAFDAPSCSGKSTHLVRSNYIEKSTGIWENEGINNLVTIYPNPANEQIIISFSDYKVNEKPLIELFDITGKIKEASLLRSKSTILDISDLAKGVFILKLTDKIGVAVKKLIKE